MQTIAIAKLGLVLIPALAVVFVLWRWSHEALVSLHALARMVIQLILIGYVLTYIFETEYAGLVLVVLSVMLLVSSWIALRPVPAHRLRLYWTALLANTVVNGLLLALITAGVLQSQPWYDPSIVIPLAGMVFAAGMNAIGQFVERFYAELSNQASLVSARNAAYGATMIPTINSLFAVGLVSLPGMMTGQILSGVSPLIAVRYQIMIMLMIFASSGLTAALFYTLVRRHVTAAQD